MTILELNRKTRQAVDAAAQIRGVSTDQIYFELHIDMIFRRYGLPGLYEQAEERHGMT